ncbi:MAG: DUF4358 domain-containing protein [Clostridia bacterium]|nr:DUF4358 domain-containing protein [Clostridia bacterium]
MKRFVSLLLALLMLALPLAACDKNSDGTSSGGDEPAKTIDVQAEADAVISKYSLSGGKRYTSESTVLGEYLDEDLIRSYYGDAAEMPDFGSVEAYAVYIDESKPTLPCEFGIFKMKDGADTDTFVAFLKARIDLKLENAKSYPTMDTSMLKTAKFTVKGGYVWYCAVKDGNEDIDSTLEGKL